MCLTKGTLGRQPDLAPDQGCCRRRNMELGGKGRGPMTEQKKASGIGKIE